MPVDPIRVYTEASLDIADSAARSGSQREDSSSKTLQAFINDKVDAMRRQNISRKKVEKFIKETGQVSDEIAKQAAIDCFDWDIVIS